MAKLFWGAGVLFVPISLFLASKFGTPGYSGPGGWGSGFMILLVGILAISPSLVVNGFFALLVGHQLAKRRQVRAGLFGLLFGAGLAAPAALSLATFAWLLTLHPSAAGRTYAAYGGMYIAVALIWLRVVDGVTLTRWDVVGAAIALSGMAVIALQPD